MATLQQFCLRWNNHQPNFISVFTNLLTNEALVDVTLAAEGRHLQAHKVVLSACSSYFQTLFTINPCQHPIVILKDVKFDDLKTMVDFMYYGEVNVSQEQLPAILKTAEMLKVKGLAEMPENNTSSGSLRVTKSESVSFDKAEILTSTDSTWGLDIRRSPSPMSPSIRRKRLRKSSTGSGSGSTERTSDELPSEITIVPMHSSIKPEVVSTIHGRDSVRSNSSLRTSIQEPSTDSEPREGSQESIDEDPLSLQASQDNSTGSMEHVIEDSSPGPSTSQQATTPQVYKPGKRSRGPLTRQPRIKKESDQPHTSPDTEPSSPQFASQPSLLPLPPVRIETQSPPTTLPPSPPNPFPPVPSHNLLSVPQTTYLVKQHSHPLLPSQKTVHSPSSTNLIVQRQHSTPTPGSGTYSNPPPLVVDTIPRSVSPQAEVPVLRVTSDAPEIRPRVRVEEFRRTASSPQVSTTRDSFEPRSVHCPMLRPGPALGCNFCWNTIDGHGRILRRKTKYHCPECQTNLCIVPCFQEYHEKNIAGLGSSRELTGTTSPTIVKPTLPKTSSI